MKIYVNGVPRELTPEEFEAWKNQKEINRAPTDAERIDALEDAIRKGMSL